MEFSFSKLVRWLFILVLALPGLAYGKEDPEFPVDLQSPVDAKGGQTWLEVLSQILIHPMVGKDGDNPTLGTFSTNLSMIRDRIDADVVHSHTWYGSMAGFMAKVLYDIPYVATVHSLEPLRPWKEEQLGRSYRLTAWIERVALEAADRETREPGSLADVRAIDAWARAYAAEAASTLKSKDL